MSIEVLLAFSGHGILSFSYKTLSDLNEPQYGMLLEHIRISITS